MQTIRTKNLYILIAMCLMSALAWADKESDYYVIESLPLPPGVEFEVGALALMSGDKLAAASRYGDVYVYDNIYTENLDNASYQLYASGLHEPLGLTYKDGSLFATQRPEISRLQDRDGDGVGDLFFTLNSEWEVNGDYHEYAFGSNHDKDGNIWIVLCLSGSIHSNSFLRGWCVRITPEGKMIPTATGIRSPGGIGANAEGDMFYTDNQGFWNGSSSLKHLKVGSFQGNPTGLKWKEQLKEADNLPFEVPDFKEADRMVDAIKKNPTLVPPAIIFPHGKIGKSPSGITWDNSKGKFGPFAGQMFVNDQTFSNVQRVFLEKVNDVYQGACFPFVSGFGSGNVAIEMSPEGYMFVGGTNRGWGSTGKAPFALERLKWTGKVPFEIHEMRAQSDGFELTFTEPVDRAIAEDTSIYEFSAYTYQYHNGYGSPEVDKKTPEVTAVQVSTDQKTVRLKVKGLVRGHVHELKCPKLRSQKKKPLLHSTAYYTLNEIPR